MTENVVKQAKNFAYELTRQFAFKSPLSHGAILADEAKVKAQRQIKDLEKKRSDKRQTLFEAQDQIDERKETLLTDIEKRLNQKMELEELFTLKWKIV